MSTKNRNTALLDAFLPLPTRTDEQLSDELDALVGDATCGDRRAIGCIAMAFGGALHDEARAALGSPYEQLAGDVAQEFYLGLLERRFTLPEIRGCARAWLKRVIRSIAAEVAFEMGEQGEGPDEAG
jgi:hypothetical protein